MNVQIYKTKLFGQQQWQSLSQLCSDNFEDGGGDNAYGLLMLFKGVWTKCLVESCSEERAHLKKDHHDGDNFYWKGVITCGSD